MRCCFKQAIWIMYKSRAGRCALCSEPAPIPSAERCALHAGGGGHMHVGVDMHTYIAAAARSALERSAS